jgi:REP element-mobilizing transposase RayT
MKQLSFGSRFHLAPRTEHGGATRLGRRKLSRPIDTKRPIHLVLRSSRARGAWSLRGSNTERLVRQAMRRYARRYAIRVYGFANAGNHLHLLVRSKCRFALQDFLRVFAGVIARMVTGARKGGAVGKFWDAIAYSRIVGWGRDFFGALAYVVQNEFEAMGYPYQKRAPSRAGAGPPAPPWHAECSPSARPPR